MRIFSGGGEYLMGFHLLGGFVFFGNGEHRATEGNTNKTNVIWKKVNGKDKERDRETE